jgi:transcriptional regulator of arginine metabolism
MRNKSERLLAIRKLIREEKLASQEELMHRLKKEGFIMTQATLSRDLKYLRVSKMYDADRGYIYFLPDTETATQQVPWTSFLQDGMISMEFAQGMAIVKTLPGYASSIASAIDSMNIVEIAGTIAGDDTILIIPRDGATREAITDQLSAVMPGV